MAIVVRVTTRLLPRQFGLILIRKRHPPTRRRLSTKTAQKRRSPFVNLLQTPHYLIRGSLTRAVGCMCIGPLRLRLRRRSGNLLRGVWRYWGLSMGSTSTMPVLLMRLGFFGFRALHTSRLAILCGSSIRRCALSISWRSLPCGRKGWQYRSPIVS